MPHSSSDDGMGGGGGHGHGGGGGGGGGAVLGSVAIHQQSDSAGEHSEDGSEGESSSDDSEDDSDDDGDSDGGSEDESDDGDGGCCAVRCVWVILCGVYLFQRCKECVGLDAPVARGPVNHERSGGREIIPCPDLNEAALGCCYS